MDRCRALPIPRPGLQRGGQQEATGATSVGGMVAGMIGPVALFVAAGFEHSVANMALLPIAWGIDPAAVPVGVVVGNLLLATAGNSVGGSLVAIGLAAGHRTLLRT